MRAARLSSSMIERVLHDEATRTLCVWFRGSGKYVYEGVPRSVFEELVAAPSAGACFNARVRGHYPCRRDPERRRYRPDAAA